MIRYYSRVYISLYILHIVISVKIQPFPLLIPPRRSALFYHSPPQPFLKITTNCSEIYVILTTKILSSLLLSPSSPSSLDSLQLLLIFTSDLLSVTIITPFWLNLIILFLHKSSSISQFIILKLSLL